MSKVKTSVSIILVTIAIMCVLSDSPTLAAFLGAAAVLVSLENSG
jgi:hypothetical protein